MAALALTSGGVISLAESTTGWTGDSFSLEPDIKVEGSNSVSAGQTNSGANDIYFAGTFNLSGTHIRLFWNISYVGNMSATNPVQVFLSDGANTDYVTYFTASSEYAGGWVDLIVDTALFTTVNLASISQVGVRVNTASKPRNVPANAWFDNWRYSNGVEIYSTTTEAVSFNDAVTQDVANAYGVLKKIDGIIFVPGEIILGRTTADNANIVSTNETIVFPDRLVTSNLYKISTQQGTGATDIDISGLVCKTIGGTAAEIDFSSSLNSLSMVGCSFIDSGNITMTPTVTSPTFSSNSFTGCGTTSISIPAVCCTWNNSGTVTVSGNGTLTGCNINTSASTIAVSVPDLADIIECNFVGDGTGHAVELTSLGSGTMTWDATFDSTTYAATNGSTGNEVLFVNVGSGTLNLSIAAGADTPTIRSAGATVNIVITSTLTLNGLVDGTEVRVYQAGTTTEVAGQETVNGGTYSTPISVSAVDISVLALGYLNLRIKNVPTNSDATIPVQQIVDRQYSNPV